MSSDVIKDWLKVAGRYQVLTKEQEQALAIAIQDSLKFPDDEQKKSRGAIAEKKLILHNLRLVISVAKFYYHRHSKHRNILLEDLIQEGNAVLKTAVQRFNPELGYKFSTYCTWWLKQSMQRYIDNHKTLIRLPLHAQESYRKVQKAVRELSLQGKEITASAIARQSGISLEKLGSLTTAKRVSLTYSFDYTYTEKGATLDLLKALKPKNHEDPYKACEAKLIDAIAELEFEQRISLIWKYGLDGEKPRTQQQIGDRLGKKKQEVRTIQKKAIARLKQNAPYLKDLLEG